jgi:broad specificity polyphosphatase/5'/3'-nucleotidase SurE
MKDLPYICININLKDISKVEDFEVEVQKQWQKMRYEEFMKFHDVNESEQTFIFNMVVKWLQTYYTDLKSEICHYDEIYMMQRVHTFTLNVKTTFFLY